MLKVEEMTGGRLKFDVLAAGSVVPGFQMQDAVHAGILDGGHGVCDIWYRKHKAASLFGSPPPFGWDAHGMLAWFYAGGGEALYRELVNDILKLNVVGLLHFPMPSQPLGWFRKDIKGVDDLKGISYRSEGIAADLFRALGASVTILPSGEIMQAMDRTDNNITKSAKLLGLTFRTLQYRLEKFGIKKDENGLQAFGKILMN